MNWFATTSSTVRMCWFYDTVKMFHSGDWSDLITQDGGDQPEVCTPAFYEHAFGLCRILAACFFVRWACYSL